MWFEMAGRTPFLDGFIKNTYRVVKKMWFEMAGRTPSRKELYLRCTGALLIPG